MEGLRRSIERGVVMTTERYSNGSNSNGGWQKAALAALWAVVMLFAGWMYSSSADAARKDADARAETSRTVQALSERLATQEEATRNIRESLRRIEEGVNDLRGHGSVK
jgi:phage shock protein A